MTLLTEVIKRSGGCVLKVIAMTQLLMVEQVETEDVLIAQEAKLVIAIIY